jgi:hypothetical protein
MAQNSLRDNSDIDIASGKSEIKKRGKQAKEKDEKRNNADNTTKVTSLQASSLKKKRK